MKSVMKNNLTLFVSALAAILLVVFLFRHSSAKPMEKIIHRGARPGAQIFSAVGFWLHDKFSFVGSIASIKKENEDLMMDNIRLKSQLALLKDIKQENEIMRQEIKLAPRKDYDLQAAFVIGQDVSNQMDMVYIDKGSEDGLREGMAVVVGEGNLVGKVWKVYPKDSAVELILNRESRVNAEIEGVGEKGIVKGDYGTSVILDMIPQTVEVNQGDAVITSGLGNTLPRGLLIGYIKETIPAPDQLFQRASLVLPTQPQKLRLVWVIKS